MKLVSLNQKTNMENKMKKTNIHHAIIEVSDGAHSL